MLTVAGLAATLLHNPNYASYWSTPAAAAFQALQSLHGLYVPALLGLLTLPPLARRMV
jgi:hypothetical protein